MPRASEIDTVLKFLDHLPADSGARSGGTCTTCKVKRANFHSCEGETLYSYGLNLAINTVVTPRVENEDDLPISYHGVILTFPIRAGFAQRLHYSATTKRHQRAIAYLLDQVGEQQGNLGTSDYPIFKVDGAKLQEFKDKWKNRKPNQLTLILS